MKMKMMSLKKGKWLERIPYLVVCVFVLGVILFFIYQKVTNVETVGVGLIICIGAFQLAKKIRDDIIRSYTLKEFQEYKNLVEDALFYIKDYLLQRYPKYFNYDDLDSIRELRIDYHNKYLLGFRNALIEFYESRYNVCDNDNYIYFRKYAKIHMYVFAMATLLISSLAKYPVMKPKRLDYVKAIFLDKVLENFMGKFEGIGIRKRENVDIMVQLYYAFYISEQERQNYIEMVIRRKYGAK